MVEGVSETWIAEIDRAFADREGAIAEWSDTIPGTPASDAGSDREAAARAAIEALTARVWAEPVKAWSQLAPRARIVEHWLRVSHGAECAYRDEATRQLIAAIRTLTGLAPLPPYAFEIETVRQLVNTLDGAQAIGEWLGLTSAQVEAWTERDFIPPGWHHRLACEVGRRGFRLSPAVFEK